MVTYPCANLTLLHVIYLDEVKRINKNKWETWLTYFSVKCVVINTTIKNNEVCKDFIYGFMQRQRSNAWTREGIDNDQQGSSGGDAEG